MILSAAPKKARPIVREYRQQWANTRPRSEATDSNQSDPVLCFAANLLLSLCEEGLLKVVIKNFVETRAVYKVYKGTHIAPS